VKPTTIAKRLPFIVAALALLAVLSTFFAASPAHASTTGTVSGRVVLEGGGVAAAGQFQVSVRTNTATSTDVAVTATLGDGTFVIDEIPPATSYRVYVNSTAPGAFPQARSATITIPTEGGVLAAGDVLVRPYRTLSGYVLLPDGRGRAPEGSVSVAVRPFGGTDTTVLVNANGEFAFVDLLPELQRITVTYLLDDSVLGKPSTAYSIFETQSVANLEIALEHGYTFSGSVSLGEPEVTASSGTFVRISSPGKPTLTTSVGPNGTFSFTGVPAGTYSAGFYRSITGSGETLYSEVYRTVILSNSEDVTGYDVTLPTDTAIAGTVSGNGGPASSQRVELWSYDSESDGYNLVTADYTNHRGYYLFRDLEPGSYDVRFVPSNPYAPEIWNDISPYYLGDVIPLSEGENFTADATLSWGTSFNGGIFGAGFTAADFAATEVEVFVYDYDIEQWVPTGDIYLPDTSGAYYASRLYPDYYLLVATYDGPKGTAIDVSDVLLGNAAGQKRWNFYLQPQGVDFDGPLAIQQLHSSLGGDAGSLGWATDAVQSAPPGFRQSFAGGSIFSHPTYGTWPVYAGAIHDRFLARGGVSGELGWPVDRPECWGMWCGQEFSNGSIVLHVITMLHGAMGGDEGTLGAETGSIAIHGDGASQTFEHGTVYAHPDSGVWPVMYGLIHTEYLARGGFEGSLGWPTGFETCEGLVCTQTFQGGTLTLGPTAPVSTVAPTVTGGTAVGTTWTLTTGTWTGTPTPTLQRGWLRCNNPVTTNFTSVPAGCVGISGASGSTYVSTVADAGKYLTAIVTATNSAGTTRAGAPTTIATTGPTAPVNTVAPTVAGGTAVGSTWTLNTGTWTGTPTPTIKRGWLRCNNPVTTNYTGVPAGCVGISGASGSTYISTAADAGKYLTAIVTATNSAGTTRAGAATTVATDGPPPPAAPVNTVTPTVSGSAAVGSTWTLTSGTWTGTPTPTIKRGWLRCNQPVTTTYTGIPAGCVGISGASGSTYISTTADAGKYLTAIVTATNSAGTTRAGAPTTITTTGPTAPANTVTPTVSGSAAVGSTWTLSVGTWNGTPAPTLQRGWLRCNQPVSTNYTGVPAGCVGIKGASGSTYISTTADAGKYITAIVTATNSSGTTRAGAHTTVATTGP
jgi:hypothetical protein